MKQPNLSPGARIGIGFLSFLLCVALFATAICACLVASGRVLTSAGSLQQIIQELLTASSGHDTAAVPQKGYTVQPLSAAPSGDGMDLDMGTDLDMTDALLDFIMEAVESQIGELPISREEVGDLIDRSTAKDYLAEKAAGMVSDFIRGEATTTIEPEEIRQLIEENEELISQVIGEPLPSEFTEQIVTWVVENETIEQLNKEGIVSLIPIPDEVPHPSQGLASSLYQMNEIMVIVRSAISLSALLGFIGVCLVLMALIVLCNWGRWGIGLRRCGYPLVLAGLPLFLCLSAQFGTPPQQRCHCKGDLAGFGLPFRYFRHCFCAGCRFYHRRLRVGPPAKESCHASGNGPCDGGIRPPGSRSHFLSGSSRRRGFDRRSPRSSGMTYDLQMECDHPRPQRGYAPPGLCVSAGGL